MTDNPSNLGNCVTADKFARTLTMTDLVTGWTENCSIRNNASKWIMEGIEQLQGCFPFAMVIFDSDCGSEFINHDVAAWLQARDIAQTRSRPYQKNDQAHVESKNNHVVRKHAFYWRYDTAQELELLNRLWQLVSLRLNFFTPTRRPSGTPPPHRAAAHGSMTSRPPRGNAYRHQECLTPNTFRL
ncbi:hypothetical protein MLAC_12170 [Mycobacterium lacus]|uniref:Integrase catalytic domain-containing protein n=1 Tax=Mycobacterium lacus TaxID=169765 RepID=A0A7I7NHY6_9MYCO|nr:hypothetical protein MLAC_12170 [Mycobacterium lacus]